MVMEDKVSATNSLTWKSGKENIQLTPIQCRRLFTAIYGGKLKYCVMRNYRFRLLRALSEGGDISGMFGIN